MKKPETPKPAAAKPETPSETISIDSQGNASVDPAQKTAPNAAQGTTGSGPAKAPDDKKADDKKPDNWTIKPGQSDLKSAKKDDVPAKPVKKRGGLLWIIAIIGLIIITAWAGRDRWWHHAEPTLTTVLPSSLIGALAPDNAANGGTDSTASDTPAPTPDINIPSDETVTDTDTASDDILPAVPASPTLSSEPDTAEDKEVIVDPSLTARLSELEGTISALRERLDQDQGDSLNNTVAQRMAEIETRTAPIAELARVEAELAGVASEMRDMSARLATMEEEVRATAGLRIEGRGQAIGIAVAILRDAVQRGGPFQVALNQLERSGTDDPLVAEQIVLLKPFANTGAPTIENLRQSFPAIAQEAIRASTDDHSGSVLDATLANLQKLFPVRRVDVAGQESLDGRLASAEQALEHNDLDAAITALEGVEGVNAQQAIAPWLTRAKDRQTIDTSLATLSSRAITLLTGTGDGQ
ncbi:COG4223 family protein [Thalassospira sp.]|uniref:COG4223 family protein n=1 Tax=Thalassospira sp. TaxID=1912094 RepID=UPI002732A476|nr:mitofilin family membrane protein [Thalassospira sp.]MDP2699079.1 mitofilin family membrane protein [Thalassospira sp.]